MAVSTLTAQDLLRRLDAAGDALSHISLVQITTFLEISAKVWPEISKTPLNRSSPDLLRSIELPDNVVSFLAAVVKLSPLEIGKLWAILRDVVCEYQSLPSWEDSFRLHGPKHKLDAYQLAPPVHSCIHCLHRLGELRTFESRLFTLHHGVVTVYPKSLYCRDCRTRYYCNYSVTNADDSSAQRSYYFGLHQFMQVAEYSYIEDKLCVFIENQMCFAHASSATIVRIYNQALGSSTVSNIPNQSELLDRLPETLVLDSFFLHALLRHSNRIGVGLTVPHHGNQRNRFDTALAERNYYMVGTGQEMWSHACSQCHFAFADEAGYFCIDAGVTDGITLGHVCCSVHDCRIPIGSPQDRFCPTHAFKRNECSITTCTLPAEAGYRTCSLEEHREVEINRKSAVSQRQNNRRYFRAGIADTSTAPTGSAPSLKMQAARRWTHNEQIFVRCCGIILSRATFYGSEGVSGVKDFLKVTFPQEFPGSLPSYIFYDHNCGLYAHLQAQRDSYFCNVGLPIDVFHAFNKSHAHSEECNRTCNPKLFPELRRNGAWIFNSSAAEQANVWLGGFQAIIKEMPIEKYNFYLDEMISLRNQFTHSQLEARGQRPHLKPEHVLRGRLREDALVP